MLKRIKGFFEERTREATSVHINEQAILSGFGEFHEQLNGVNAQFQNSVLQCAQGGVPAHIKMLLDAHSLMIAVRGFVMMANRATQGFISPDLAIKMTQYCGEADKTVSQAEAEYNRIIEEYYQGNENMSGRVRSVYDAMLTQRTECDSGFYGLEQKLAQAIRLRDLPAVWDGLKELKAGYEASGETQKAMFVSHMQRGIDRFRSEDVHSEILSRG